MPEEARRSPRWFERLKQDRPLHKQSLAIRLIYTVVYPVGAGGLASLAVRELLDGGTAAQAAAWIVAGVAGAVVAYLEIWRPRASGRDDAGA